MNIRFSLRFLSKLKVHFSIVDNLMLDSLSCHLLLKSLHIVLSFLWCFGNPVQVLICLQDQTWYFHHYGAYNRLDITAFVCGLVCMENC